MGVYDACSDLITVLRSQNDLRGSDLVLRFLHSFLDDLAVWFSDFLPFDLLVPFLFFWVSSFELLQELPVLFLWSSS